MTRLYLLLYFLFLTFQVGGQVQLPNNQAPVLPARPLPAEAYKNNLLKVGHDMMMSLMMLSLVMMFLMIMSLKVMS